MQENKTTIRPEDVPQMYAVCFNDQCPLFRQFRIVRLAWGFRTLFADVQKKDYDHLRSKVIFHFSSESDFWRYNRGYYKLTPEQQEAILDIFRQHGYDPASRRFQHYVEQFDFSENT